MHAMAVPHAPLSPVVVEPCILSLRRGENSENTVSSKEDRQGTKKRTPRPAQATQFLMSQSLTLLCICPSFLSPAPPLRVRCR